MAERYVGLDVGAETLRVVGLEEREGTLAVARRTILEHHKDPASAVIAVLRDWDWESVTAAAVTGRLGRLLALPQVPTKQAQALGFRFSHGDAPATIVSIGCHGFSVLELRAAGVEIYRENSRCSQGTGNFLRQLVERFDLDIEEASALCEDVPDPAPLSGRCPVILKTDMTHLANKGESKPRILAGLYDAVCENVQVLIKPRTSPDRVLLLGGVTRSKRVRDRFHDFCVRHEMHLIDADRDDALHLEALGAALVAADDPKELPALEDILVQRESAHLDHVPALRGSLGRVRRMKRAAPRPEGEGALVLGFDVGSTGSKIVALDLATRETAWEGYGRTNGDPVGAAHELLRQFVASKASHRPVVAFGATGSGREIVGSLLATCYGPDRVHVLNEIAAHATGAAFFDPRVDTIFEIGGQDAKYIRLVDGRVVDAAMNEACSAGTGSFIEEQGKKFAGIRDVGHLGEEALGADEGVSLGQHCSVFMAEIIDEAVAAGVETRSIVAGIYDSIIQNYLNRVKGSRPVGQLVFCQGMPFASDALAAAVARQTGSDVVVPPNPGTVGALGIALLTVDALKKGMRTPLNLDRFLEARIESKDNFVCKSAKGCGGAGNHCRIDRLATLCDGKKQRFTWGGSCSLWDKGTGRKKLPDLAPDPFRDRDDLVASILDDLRKNDDARPRVALPDDFALKGFIPFFATFIRELGFDLVVGRGGDHKTLKRGIEEANVPFCAPMQLHHGLVSRLADEQAEHLFLPMVRSLPRSGDEPLAVVCPIVQAAPDILSWDLGERAKGRVVSPVIDVDEKGLRGPAFLASCMRVAKAFEASPMKAWQAYRVALEVQERFEEACMEAGRAALAFCKEHDVIPVVVLGRPYTIHDKVLNSNVPALLREQGAIGIPIDCYPVEADVPTFQGVYWGHGQRNLRAAHQIARTEGLYSLWCSNYSCGPDSFNLHFYAYAMAGKPFAVIETDGHAGDAGTKTRIEAFLHCVRQDLASHQRNANPNDLRRVQRQKHGLPEIKKNGETVLVPRMGASADALSACLRGIGIPAETLPMPDRDVLRGGRRHTSGKECVPMTLTLGSLLERLERAEKDEEHKRFAFFMPTANGPCRFGVYNMLHRIVLERLGSADRVRIWSPVDSDYFEGVPAGFAAAVFTGFCAADFLLQGLYDARPFERRVGAAQEIYDRHHAALVRQLEVATKGDLSMQNVVMQIASGRLFGVTELLKRASRELASVRTEREMPRVMVVGEIYVRCDPFANDFVVDQLERRGIQVHFAPFNEWLEYSDISSWEKGEKSGIGAHLSSFLQKRILERTYAAMGGSLSWPARGTVDESVEASSPWIRSDLCGEAVLTVGGPLHEFRRGEIVGVVSVGPLECMPNKIAEAQFFHVAERDGLASLTLNLNGDPIDPAVLDCFAFEVHERFRKAKKARVEEERALEG